MKGAAKGSGSCYTGWDKIMMKVDWLWPSKVRICAYFAAARITMDYLHHYFRYIKMFFQIVFFFFNPFFLQFPSSLGKSTVHPEARDGAAAAADELRRVSEACDKGLPSLPFANRCQHPL